MVLYVIYLSYGELDEKGFIDNDGDLGLEIVEAMTFVSIREAMEYLMECPTLQDNNPSVRIFPLTHFEN